MMLLSRRSLVAASCLVLASTVSCSSTRAQVATCASARVVGDLLPNGDFAGGAKVPIGWELQKGASASVRLTRDMASGHGAAGSLCLDTTDGSPLKCAAQTAFASVPQPGASVELRGFTRASGTDWKQFQLILQVFNADWSKQLDWIAVDAPHEGGWKSFEKTVDLPAGAAHVITYFSVDGVGKAWLDDVSAVAIAAPDPAGAPVPVAPTAPVTVKNMIVPYHWDNAIYGGVEYATGLIWSPTHPETVYLRADGGGVWRLNRAKHRWDSLSDQLTWKDRDLVTADSVAVDPSDPDTLYVAGGGGRWSQTHDVLKTVDGGKTWARTGLKNERGEPVLSAGNGDDKQGGERLCINPRAPKTVWFGTRNDGLFVTRDGARTWKSVKSFPAKGGRYTGLTFVSADATRNLLYVGVHRGARDDEPDAPTVPGGVYRSADDGMTWTLLSGGPEGGANPMRGRLAPDGTLYVTAIGSGTADKPGGGGSVWKYAGGIWRDITPSGGKGKAFCGINLDPKNPRRIVCAPTYGALGTVYYSEDAGETWRVYAFDKSNPLGGTIARVSYPAWDSGPGYDWGGNASDVAFDTADPTSLYHMSFSGPSIITGLGTDKLKASLFGEGREQMTVASGVSPSVGAAFVSGVWDCGAFRHDALDKYPSRKIPLLSADGKPGTEGWRNVFQDVFDMDASPKMPDVIAVAGGWQWNNSGTAAVSRDNGKTLREFASKPTPGAKFGRIAVSADDADNLVWMPMDDVKGENKPTFFTTDGGKSWSAGSGAPSGCINGDGPWTFFKPLAADRVKPHTFYLYDRRDGGFFASEDGGATWKRRATLPTQAGAHFDSHKLLTAPGMAGDVWLSLSEKGLLHSADGGKTWTRLSGVEWSVQAAFGKAAPGTKTPTLFVYGQLGGTHPASDTAVSAALYRSIDLGKTFVRVNPTSQGLNGIGVLIGDMQVFGRVYVGTGGRGFFYGEPADTPAVAKRR